MPKFGIKTLERWPRWVAYVVEAETIESAIAMVRGNAVAPVNDKHVCDEPDEVVEFHEVELLDYESEPITTPATSPPAVKPVNKSSLTGEQAIELLRSISEVLWNGGVERDHDCVDDIQSISGILEGAGFNANGSIPAVKLHDYWEYKFALERIQEVLWQEEGKEGPVWNANKLWDYGKDLRYISELVRDAGLGPENYDEDDAPAFKPTKATNRISTEHLIDKVRYILRHAVRHPGSGRYFNQAGMLSAIAALFEAAGFSVSESASVPLPPRYAPTTSSIENPVGSWHAEAAVGNANGIFDAAYNFGQEQDDEANATGSPEEIGKAVESLLEDLTCGDVERMKYGTNDFHIQILIRPAAAMADKASD